MPTYAIRVFLPDRPGALGSIATTIGGLGGDVRGIDILDRKDGLVLDEFVLELSGDEHLEKLVDEVSKIEGAFVEDVRRLPRYMVDGKSDSLETAAVLVAQTSVEDLLSSLVTHGMLTLGAKWAAVLRTAGREEAGTVRNAAAMGSPVASAGLCPSRQWLQSFVQIGSGREPNGVVAVADMEAAGLVLAIGRPGSPFREREHKEIAALARIADHHWRGITGTWVWKLGGSSAERSTA